MKVRVFQDPKEKKRRGPRSCPWSVEWRVNGNRRSKTIGTKADAEKFATLKRAQLIDGAMGISTRKRWSEFIEEYMSDDALEPGGYLSERGLVALSDDARAALQDAVLDARTMEMN